jgi:hypothetical protein
MDGTGLVELERIPEEEENCLFNNCMENGVTDGLGIGMGSGFEVYN